MGLEGVVETLILSVRDGFVQVSAFVAVTVLLFSYVQYRTGGRIVAYLEAHERLQPIAGALLGLTPGCGGAIVAMPLYVRGTVSFGTVVATLAATAGDSAFVILALAPEAAAYAYGMAFVAAVLFGYAVDLWGLGVGRVDDAVASIGRPATDGGFATASVAEGGPSVSGYRRDCGAESETRGGSELMTAVTHGAHVLWWVVAAAGLVAGVEYLRRGAPEVALTFGPTFFGLFTVAGLVGTTLSFYLYFVGRRYVGAGGAGRAGEFSKTYDAFRHAAMETSMVTVWVIVAYLTYEYAVAFLALDIGALAAASGVLAPVAGAALGLVPGCAPQIVFATLYANGDVPFSALTANAISQDGDALFPLMAIDAKAAVVATIYTTVPALIVGVAVHVLWPYADFGFGVVG